MANIRNLPASVVLEKLMRFINRRKRLNIQIETIPWDDRTTWRLFCNGDTANVFQFRANRMPEYLKELQPDCLADLEMLFTLYCPTQHNLLLQFIICKKAGIPFKYNADVVSKGRKSFIIRHTIIAWKQAYLKAHYRKEWDIFWRIHKRLELINQIVDMLFRQIKYLQQGSRKLNRVGNIFKIN